MSKIRIRSFDDPDEVLELDLLRSEMVNVAGLTVSHDRHEPGWRWSTHIKPIVGTEWCRVRHIGVILAGRIGVVLEDGTEAECGGISVVDIPAGHDVWVVGDQTLEALFWTGTRGWVDPTEALRERVLTTIAFTDIVDSTATARQLGPTAWSELIAAHDARVRDALGRFLGTEIRMTGDGVLATFDGAARAVRCVRSIIDDTRELGIDVRAAIHTGEVEIAGDELRGIAVHEAARILDHADGGEVLVSAVTAGLIADAGFTLDDRGEHPMKGLDGARRVFAVS